MSTLSYYPGIPKDLDTKVIELRSKINASHNSLTHAPQPDEVVRSCREVLGLDPGGHLCLHDNLNFAHILFEAYGWLGDTSLLDTIVTVGQEALQLCAPRSLDRSELLDLLARAYHEQHYHLRDQASLEDALRHAQVALELRIAGGYGPIEKTLSTLSIIHFSLWESTSDPNALKKSVSYARQGLKLTPSSSRGYPYLLDNLACSLEHTFRHIGGVAFLDECIEVTQQALEICQPEHPLRATVLSRWASHCRFLFHRSGDEKFAKEDLRYGQGALRLRPPGHPRHAHSLIQVGLALYEQYQDSGRGEDLDEAIRMTREVFLSHSSEHPFRQRTAGNLGNMLRSRYESTGDAHSLDEAASIFMETLRLRPPGHYLRIHALCDCAVSLHDQFYQSKDATLLNKAQQYFEDAFAICSTDHPLYGWLSINFANVLCDMHKTGGNTNLLSRAIYLLEESLQSDMHGDLRHRTAITNLIKALHQSYLSTGEISLLDKSIFLCDQLIDSYHLYHPNRHTALALRVSVSLDGIPLQVDLPAILERFSLMIDDVHAPPRGRLKEALHILEKLSAIYRSQYPELDSSSLHLQILSVYQKTIDLLPLVANFGLDIRSRLRELACAQSLSSMGAALAIDHGKGSLAVEMLEASRAVFWAQALRLRDTMFGNLSSETAKELENLFHDLSQQPKRAELSDEDIASRRKMGEAVQKLLQDIRGRPGFERFLLGRRFSEFTCAASKGPVVMLAADWSGCHALLLGSSDEVQHIPLPDISQERLQKLVYRVGELHEQRGLSSEGPPRLARLTVVRRNMRGTSDAFTLGDVLRELWLKVVYPILLTLGIKKSHGRHRARLHWCPTGSFVFAPLHAAGIYNGTGLACCSDYVISSYTPTLSALITAREEWKSPEMKDLRALVIAEASPPGVRQIPYAMDEAKAVVDAFVKSSCNVETQGFDVVQGSGVDLALEQLNDANLVHFACHGNQHLGDPLESGFRLRDKALTVAMLMKLRLPNAYFAFLSACETAKGDKNQPDQLIHLAAAVLHAGFKSIVATMWPIQDEDGPIIAQAFYQELLQYGRLEMEDIVYALDAAVGRLRDHGVSLERWASFVHIGA